MEQRAVENLSDLVADVVEFAGNQEDQEWWFRGHGCGSWSLIPSLYRRVIDVGEALQIEARVLREFDNRSRSVAERSGAREPWELLFLMQHHQVPTRLLDWSRNLLIAAFFAVYSDSAWADPDDPPAVFVLSPRQWNSQVVGPAGLTAAGPSGVIGDLTGGLMASYEPRASGGPVGPAQRHALAIAGPEFAARIVAQRGAFTVFGTLAPDGAQSLQDQEEVLKPASSTLTKILLTGKEREWRKALRLVGIGEFSAFPDLDGLARELGSSYF